MHFSKYKFRNPWIIIPGDSEHRDVGIERAVTFYFTGWRTLINGDCTRRIVLLNKRGRYLLGPKPFASKTTQSMCNNDFSSFVILLQLRLQLSQHFHRFVVIIMHNVWINQVRIRLVLLYLYHGAAILIFPHWYQCKPNRGRKKIIVWFLFAKWLWAFIIVIWYKRNMTKMEGAW